MIDSNAVKELVNAPGRVGVLATADRKGYPNVAVFGSAYMPDELTLIVAMGDTRTAQNLLETGRAVFMSVLPHENPMNTQGCRVYLKLRSMEKDGPNLDGVKAHVAEIANEKAAQMVKYAVFFDIESTRPLIDWSPKK
ncbi:MAG: pyridoxamine 5'-phosphate oxidase family protein [Deltaproteobacteria bacterium]|nr:pyridoxamine 5'-phosphate oxidase family protein [Deltaproteobacteria bacterium]